MFIDENPGDDFAFTSSKNYHLGYVDRVLGSTGLVSYGARLRLKRGALHVSHHT